MTDIPIIFSAPMVQALLDGRKTMTRRLAWEWREFPEIEQRLRRSSLWQRAKPGDRLWVRETWRDGAMAVMYRADGNGGALATWRSPIHMRRKDSRITLVVTATKIEPLQKISHDDAVAEGVGIFPHSMSAQKRFKELWESLHGADSWSGNPDVVAMTFEVHRQNIGRKAA